MNRNAYICLLLFSLLSLAGCDSVLDRVPKDTTNSATFFSNESELRRYTTQFYTMLPAASDLYNEPSDLTISNSLPDVVLGTRTINSGEAYWQWEDLRHVNYFLQHVDQCTEDTVARNHYTGVALFFRALFYYDKVRRFGDVPWYDEPVSSSDITQLRHPRQNRTLVIQKALADLDRAIPLMRTAHTPYEVNRYTAIALKARIALFEGTWLRYHQQGDEQTIQNLLTQAAEASRMVLTEGGYSLHLGGTQPYRDLFTSLTADPDEVILARAYNATISLTHNATSYLRCQSEGQCGATKHLLNQYLLLSGEPYTNQAGYDTISLHNELTNRDPRLAQTLFVPGQYVALNKTEVEPYTFSTSPTGYQLIKYVLEDSYGFNKSDNDMPLFRLAEQCLVYAEAKAELGTLTQQDLDMSLNLLRDRVGMPHLLLSSLTAEDPYLQTLYQHITRTPSAQRAAVLEVRRERAVELVLEGFRYDDLMRWAEGEALAQPMLGAAFAGEGKYDLSGDGKSNLILWQAKKPFDLTSIFLKIGTDIILYPDGDRGAKLVHGTLEQPNGGRKFEDKHYLYPIPLTEIILTENALTQNPGWE